MAMQNTKIPFATGMTYVVRSLVYMGNQKGKFLAGAFFASSELLVAYITPILFQQMTRALETGVYSNMWTILLVLSAVSTILTPVIMLGNYWKKAGTTEATKNLGIAMFDKVQHLPVKTIEQYGIGDLLTRISNDANSAIKPLSGHTFTTLMKFILYTVISVTVLLAASWQYLMVGLAMSVISVVVSFSVFTKARQIEQQAKVLAAGTASPLMEAVANGPIVRVFGLADKLKAAFAEKCSQIAQKRVMYRTVNGIGDGVVYLFSSCVQPVTFLMGIYLMLQGELTISSVVFLSGITGILAEGVRSFGQFIQFVQSGFVSLFRAFELLELPEEYMKPACRPRNADTEVCLTNVHFGYSGTEILHGIDLEVPKGQKVAVVGASGCGKSTLMKLIIRLYEPNSGRLDLPENVAYVSQVSDIFSGTILENIESGRQRATFEEIEEAARQAGCKSFIEQQPQRYETFVDENGTNLSGGQKQRIAIARALLKNASLLVLDEMTSAMDNETEDMILSELLVAARDKTILMVTHKASAASRMDRIVVMEAGRIVEDGSHEELIIKDGAYCHLYSEHHNR